MNHYFYNKVMVVDNLSSPLYDKAIFILKEREAGSISAKNMVQEAEKIIENYIRNQPTRTVQKMKSATNYQMRPVNHHHRDRILNWCLFGSSGLLIYYIVQLYL